MGYECPVCATEEADGEHLANHLAFTALVRGGDHEAWLDEHVSDWADRDPEGLAEDVVEHATETDSEPTSESHDHDVPAVERTEGADLSGEAAEILAEAEEMTRRIHEGDENAGDDGVENAGDDAGDERAGDDAGGERAGDDETSEQTGGGTESENE